MKKLLSILLVLCMLLAFAGCGEEGIGESGSGVDTNTTESTATTAASEESGDAVSSQSSLKSGEIPILSSEQEQKIKENYYKWERKKYFKTESEKKFFDENYTATDVRITKYFGTYSGCEVMFVGGLGVDYNDVITKQIIAGVTFLHPSSQPIFVHKNEEFIELPTAYETGVITKQDVEKIQGNY